MDRLSPQPRPTRARKSLWVNDDGSIIDRLIPSGRWTPREEVPRLWAGCRDRLGDGCYRFKPKLDKDGVPPLFAEAERRRAKRAKEKAECECEEKPAAKARPARPPRRISGERLAAMVRLDPELEAEVAGREVELDDEAWGAVQAAHQLRARVETRRKKIERRRGKIWPDKAAAANNGAAAADPCDCQVPSIVAFERYVDSEEGDDRDPGTYAADRSGRIRLRPWKSLRRVEEWLNDDIYGDAERGERCVLKAAVYFRRGRTWDGTEEPMAFSTELTPLDWAYPDQNERGDKAILSIYNFKAAQGSYLILAAYPEDTGVSDAVRLYPPTIDGVVATPAFNNQPQVDDPRIGLAIYDSCYVAVDGLQIRGFNIGIDVRGGCKHHQYTDLRIRDHAQVGIRVSVTEEDAEHVLPGLGVAAQVTEMIAQGLYPDEIVISDSSFRSIGYDTAGSDIGLGFLATNCTITGNTLLGDDDATGPRGVDGIVADYASSGHLIEGNRIGTHRMWCDGTKLDTSGGCTPAMSLQVETACTNAYAACTPTDYGFSIINEVPTGNDSAFGEDGIDLKAVRSRTPTAKVETIVAGNVIWGHTNFSGITINDGSQNIHILQNRIFLNAEGIHVTNSWNDAWHHLYEPGWFGKKTENVYIYRNLVYMNFGRGVHIGNSREHGFNLEVENVYVVGNTIAHNLSTGLRVSLGAGTTSGVSDIFNYNNLFMRSGLESPDGDIYDQAGSMQVAWSGAIPMGAGGGTSSNNCYLGWNRVLGNSAALENVIRWGSQTYTVADALLAGVEVNSNQATGILEVDLQGRLHLKTMEALALDGTSPVPLGDQYRGAMHSEIESIGDAYDIGSWSLCTARGTASVGVLQVNEDVTRDIALCNDVESVAVLGGVPDIGAFEGPIGREGTWIEPI